MEKRILLLAIVAVAVFLCGSAFALDPMGPPMAGLDQEQWSVGAEWSYSEMHLNWPVYESTRKYQLKTNKVYANLGYGITDNCQVFMRAGYAEMGYGRPNSYQWKGDDDSAIAIGFGLKSTLYEQAPDIKWGGLVQYSWADFAGRRENDNGTHGDFDAELTELQIAAGPTWQVQSGISVYGGPFFHYVGGHHATRSPNTNSHPLEEIRCFGGYIGTQVDLAEDVALDVEYQDTGEAFAFAACLVWRQ